MHTAALRETTTTSTDTMPRTLAAAAGSARAQRQPVLRLAAACACAVGAAAQSPMTSGCDTQAMLRDMTAVQTTCCASGLASDCATGLPDTCSDACGPVFLGFLSTYRGNGCARTLEVFGERVNLHPLEVACNGGADTQHPPAPSGVCNMKAAISTCQSQGVPTATAGIAEMCADPCMAGLIPCANDPVLIASMGAAESQTLVQMQQVCGAEDQPGGNIPGDGRCSVAGMQTICQAHPPPTHANGIAADQCADPCAMEMLDCATDPMAATLMDQASLLELQHLCQSSAGDTGPGDGHCNLVAAGNLCGDNDMESSDPDTFCEHSCVREMIDCIDDPQLADHRSEIANMQSLCNGRSSGCIDEMTRLDEMMQAPCCGNTPCPEGPPPECSLRCSQMFLPFYDRCGAAFASLAADQPKGSDAAAMDDAVADLARFHGQCQTAAAGGGH